MFETAFAQLRLAYSLLTGRPFNTRSLNRLVDALLETQEEFGSLTGEAGEMMRGPALDETARREVQLRRVRAQVRYAAEETPYYAPLFANLGLDPRRLSWDDVANLPLTTKEAVRDHAEQFIRRNHRPTLRTMSTGTTGKPTTMTFTPDELETFALFSAVNMLFDRSITNEDIVQVSTSARALLGNGTFMGACQRVGALVFQTGIIDPAQALALLAEAHEIPGKKRRISSLLTYPSYLGRMLEAGLRLGYTAADFDLRGISLGGEIVTEGIKRRGQALFGPVTFGEGYGITETWPFGGTLCEQGHLHFEPSHGLLEVIDPDTGRTTEPGEIGTLVLTPFAPFRDSVVLLRYDTQDLVRQLVERPTCSQGHRPATSNLLGKKRLAVCHEHGWTTPRDVLEAAEGIDALPLPARCGFWAEGDGVAVELFAPEALRRTIGDALEAGGVPLRVLHLLDDPRQLRRPLPWRGDLHESGFEESLHARDTTMNGNPQINTDFRR